MGSHNSTFFTHKKVQKSSASSTHRGILLIRTHCILKISQKSTKMAVFEHFLAQISEITKRYKNKFCTWRNLLSQTHCIFTKSQNGPKWSMKKFARFASSEFASRVLLHVSVYRNCQNPEFSLWKH